METVHLGGRTESGPTLFSVRVCVGACTCCDALYYKGGGLCVWGGGQSYGLVALDWPSPVCVCVKQQSLSHMAA